MNNYACGPCGVQSFPSSYGIASGASAPCRPNIVTVATDFVAPPANQALTIDVSDTVSLYVGKGIRIGAGFYQIVDILSSTQISIMHSGLGLPSGTLIQAYHPTAGCFQFPIYGADQVNISYAPTILAFDADAQTVLPGAYAALSVVGNYGWSGPRTIVGELVFSGTTTGAAVYLGFALPKPRTPAIEFSSPALAQDGGALVSGTAQYGVNAYTNYLLLAKSGNVPFGVGANRGGRLPYKYEIAIS